MPLLAIQIILLTALFAWLVCIYTAYGDGIIGRRMRLKEPTVVNTPLETPPLSIVIAAHNQATALRRHLPEILAQEYERFEVIVVDMRSTDETKDVLERLELQHAQLRHTFVPASARDISIERLALTLGFRAAVNEWVVITRPDCQPASPLWLQRIGETIAQPKSGIQSPRLQTPDIVLGYARYDEQRDTMLDLKTGFYRLWATMANIRHILGGKAAVRADSCNMAYRKSLFMEHGGFAADQDLKAGAEELLVNHNATATNTAILLSPAGMVIQDRITDEHTWEQMHMFYAETRHHQHHTGLYRWHQFLRMVTPWMALLLLTLPAVAGIVLALSMPEMATILTAIVLFILSVTYYYVRITAFHTTASSLGVRNHMWLQPYLDLCIIIWHIKDRFARRMTSRNEFRKKFV